MAVTCVSKSPFIKRFRTRSAFYIYDVNTNHIVQADPVVYSIIGEIYSRTPAEIVRKWSGQFRAVEVRRAVAEIKRSIRSDRLFQADRPRDIQPFGGQSVQAKAMEAGCQQLILNVTENCNLRCRYCIYGGKYPNQRVRSPRKMSVEVAHRALDYFLARSRRVKESHIGFYGGEPLLNLALIQDCVEYVRSRTRKKYHFGFTTNGTLLNRTVARYLIKNKFNLLVSLDGPQHVHDRFRVNAKGDGSWEKVIRNLELLKDLSPSYYRNHVTLSAVLVAPGYLPETRAFFENNRLLSGLSVSTSYPVHTSNPLDEENDKDESAATHACGHCALYHDGATLLNDRRGLTNFLKGYFQRELHDIHYRPIFDGFNGGIHINGCCFPGQRRLFVSCDGQYHICERLDNGYPLGNVDEGVLPEKVAGLVNEYKKISKSCLNCWAVRFCTKCYASYNVGGKINADLRREECRSFRKDFEKVLVLYHEVAEKNPRAFDFLKHITQS